MRQATSEVTTDLVDLTGLSLAELRGTDDPVLQRSLRLVAVRTECSRIGVLQNQAPDEAPASS
jgi:FXSXX-COOH protein